MYQAPEIEYCLKKVGVKSIITDHIVKKKNHYDILKNIIPNLEDSSPGILNSEKLPDLQSVIFLSKEKLKLVLNFFWNN